MGKAWIALAGISGAGKTTVGQVVSELMNLPFYDLDQIIEQGCRLTIPEYVGRYGWEPFRRQEKLALYILLRYAHPGVLALGGGTLVDDDNWVELSTRAHLVYLEIDPRVAYLRLEQSGIEQRPLLAGGYDSLKSLFEQRQARYEQCELKVNADAPPNKVALDILEALELNV
jgi:shikimate kinase